MAQVTVAERRSYKENEAAQILLGALKGRGGRLTRSDAVAVSGLPEAEAEKGLTVLLKEYKSHLAATESGELVYEFDPAFERRDAVPFREKLARAMAALGRIAAFLFKIWIVATLIFYFVLFVVMMLALLFARRGGSDSRDDDGGGLAFYPILWFWGWGPPRGGYGYGGGYGYSRRPQRRGQPFYKSVFAFVFGPPRPAADPLQDEKEILAFLRAQKGRLVAADLVGLMGWDFQKAEEECTRLLVEYNGEPEVTEDGVVVYTFRELRKTAGDQLERVRPRYAWERVEENPPLTGNTPGKNALIAAFNGFNLLAPFWIVPAFEVRTGVSLAGMEFFLFTFPVIFSFLFFAVPLMRLLVEKSRARRRAERNQRRVLMRRIWLSEGAPRPPAELAPDDALKTTLDRALVPWGGDVVHGPEGQVLYAFPRLREERQAVERVRQLAGAKEKDAGTIVFSSQD